MRSIRRWDVQPSRLAVAVAAVAAVAAVTAGCGSGTGTGGGGPTRPPVQSSSAAGGAAPVALDDTLPAQPAIPCEFGVESSHAVS
jgi:hypothetical protein